MSLTRVTVRELRTHTSTLLDRIQHGEAVEVTRHGDVVAVLMPPDADRQAIAKLERQGILPSDWAEHQREVRQRGIGATYAPAPGAPPAEDVIGAGRDEHP